MKTLVACVLVMLGCGCSGESTDQVSSQVTHVNPTKPSGKCPVGSTYDVRIAADQPQVWSVATIDALTAWHAVLQDRWQFNVSITRNVESPPVTGCVISFYPGGQDGTAWGSTFKFSQTPNARPERATVYLNIDDTRLTPEVAYATVLHELGHVLGLSHNTDPSSHSVMWPFITVPGRLGCIDAVAACKVWDCAPTCTGNVWLTE